MTRMLVTRPEPDADATVQRLAALDIEAVAAPLLTRSTLTSSLPRSPGFAAMALTSANALRALADRDAIDSFRHLPVFAVGDRTAQEAEECGFTQVTSAGGNFSDLANLLVRQDFSGPIFYPAAKHMSGDLAKALAPFGVMVVTTKVYEMVAVDQFVPSVLDDLQTERFGAVLVYSRRTAEVFVHCLGDTLDVKKRAGLGIICMSETVAEPLMNAHFTRISLADKPTDEAMMVMALSFARDQNPS